MIEWILSSSVLIAVMIVARSLFKGKLRLTLQYGLWAVVLVRLLLPFSLGETVISVANWAQKLADQQTVETPVWQENSQEGALDYEHAYQQVVQEHINQGVAVEKLPASQLEIMEQEAMARVEESRETFALADAALLMWIVGMAAVAGLFSVSNFRFYRRHCRKAVRMDISQNRLPVYRCVGLDTPCLFGLLRPAIYVTEEAASNDTLLMHTLTHEYTHYRHGDHLWAVLRGLCLVLHWYNPLVWVAAKLSQQDAELACDESTVKALGEGKRAEYGRTLISMTCRKQTNVLLTATTMTTNGRTLRERIELIVKKPKMAMCSLVAVLLVAAIAVGCTFTGSRSPEPETEDPNISEAVDRFFEDYHPIGEYIGKHENFALVLVAEKEQVIAYRYVYENGSVQVEEEAVGNVRLINGISLNHVETEIGHLYFGTVADPGGKWVSMTLIGSGGDQVTVALGQTKGFLVTLQTQLKDFRVVNDEDQVRLNLKQYLQKYELVEAILTPARDVEVQRPVETKPAPTEPEPTQPPTTEPLPTEPQLILERVPMAEDPPVWDHGVTGLGTLYERPNETKVCIWTVVPGLCYSGDKLAYLIPEDQDAFWNALENAADGMIRDRYSGEGTQPLGWNVTYQDEHWEFYTDGSLVGHGNWIPAEYTQELLALVKAEIYAVGLKEGLRPDTVGRIVSATFDMYEKQTITDWQYLRELEAFLKTSEPLGYMGMCPLGGIITLQMANGETYTIAMASDGCPGWVSGGVYYAFEVDSYGVGIAKIFGPQMLRYGLEQGKESVFDAAANLNWSHYRVFYGADATYDAFWQFRSRLIESGNWRLAIRATDGLEGELKAAYAKMLGEFAEQYGKEFAMECFKSNMPEWKKTQVFELMAIYWDITPEAAEQKLTTMAAGK